jgi:hypothetical protein
MVLSPQGAPEAPLRICRLVHAHDGVGQCAPMVINLVRGDQVSGVILAASMVPARLIRHDPVPAIAARITIPNHPPQVTWHWPAECPWGR